MKQATMTTIVVPTTSGRPGQLTFFISVQTSRKKSRVVGHHCLIGNIALSTLPRNGRGGGIRTPNLRFWRPPLYQLELHPLIKVSGVGCQVSGSSIRCQVSGVRCQGLPSHLSPVSCLLVLVTCLLSPV